MFTEVVFWAAYGLRILDSTRRSADATAAPVWSPAVLDRLRADWGRIAQAAGVAPSALAAASLKALPIEAVYRSGKQGAGLVNFLVHFLLAEGGDVEPEADHGAEFARLMAQLGRQDLNVRAEVEASLEAPAGSFLQIGANDGSSDDDLAFQRIYHSPGWRKVLVEPVRSALTRLRQATADLPGVTIVGAAVSGESGTRTMRVFPSTRLSTLAPSVDGAERGRPVRVRCVDGPALFAEAGIATVDVLVVDTEGHDRIVLGEVLRMATPGAIVLEFVNLDMAEQIAAIELLEARGYAWCWPAVSLDLFAVKR